MQYKIDSIFDTFDELHNDFMIITKTKDNDKFARIKERCSNGNSIKVILPNIGREEKSRGGGAAAIYLISRRR